MAALEWLHGTKATAGGVRNLESLHTLALFFPLLGMAIPTVSAAICYWSSDTVFSGYEGVSGSRRHTPENAWYLEPFAAPANLAFWFAGLGLFLMPYLSGVTSGSARRLGSALMDAGVDQSTAWRVAGAASALIGLALVGQIVKNRRARQMGPSFDV